QLTGLNNFKWPDGTPMFPTASGTGAANMGNNAICPAYTNMPLYTIGPQYSSGWGGNQGFRRFITGNTTYTTGGNFGYNFLGTAKNFTYTPSTATSSNMGTFSFSGGDVTVNLLLPSATVNSAPDTRFADPTKAGRSPTPNWPPAGWPLGTNDTSPL